MAVEPMPANLPATIPNDAPVPVSDTAFVEHQSPVGEQIPLVPATVGEVFDYLALDQEPALVARLRHDWGEGAAAEIACGKALARDYPELVQIADRYDLDGNHPGILALAAKIARLSGYGASGREKSASTTSSHRPGMNSRERHSFEDRVRDVRARKQAALRHGDNRLADMLLEQEMGLYRTQDGTRPIVGGGGRTA